MREEDGGTLRAVAWLDVCPWLSIFRSFRLAASFRMMFLSAAAMLLTLSGWALLGSLWILAIEFCDGDPQIREEIEPNCACPWPAATDLVPDQPGLQQEDHYVRLDVPDSLVERSPEPFVGTWDQLSRPFRKAFKFDIESGETVSWEELAYLLICGLWALAVWAYFGGAVTRSAAVQLASEERIGWGAMLRFARTKFWAYFAAPLLPLVGVVVVSALLALLGLLLRGNVGILLASIIWPLFLLAGLLMVVLLLGLLFGWPLMFATISVEGSDSFDALSRCYAYVFQRPLHYLFYTLVAVLLGIAGWLLVSNFAAAVISLTYWATSWGCGDAGVRLVDGQVQFAFASGDSPAHVGWLGWHVIQFWCQLVKLLAVGYLYSYFWVASTAIYYLLRRHVDGTEMDEVFLDDDEGVSTCGLPPVEKDDLGAPQAVDDADGGTGEGTDDGG